jgi:hypothetical protein
MARRKSEPVRPNNPFSALLMALKDDDEESIPTKTLFLTGTDIEAVLSYSPQWAKGQRMRDTKRIDQGLEPEGPHWVTFGKRVLYPLYDMAGVPGFVTWMRSRAIPLGRAGDEADVVEQPNQAA